MSEATVRLLAWARRRTDPAMATALTGAAVGLGVTDRAGPTWVVLDGLCMVGVCVSVWWRRRYPTGVAVLAAVLMVLPYANSGGGVVYDQAVSDVAGAGVFLIALALGSQLPWRRSLLGLVALAVGVAIPGGQFNPFLLMVTVGPWLAGLALGSRQRAADQLARRARDLAEEHEIFAAASVGYERARIARELHDIVAHSVSLMVVQANAGALLASTDPDSAADAFDTISQTAEQARVEVDRLATLLDTTTPAGAAVDPAGLRVVDDLVHRARTAGLHITYEVNGDIEHLPATTADTIHRVIQEAITNALKHAPGAPITIRLHAGANVVDTEIANPAAPVGLSDAGAGLGRTGGGYGLAGMRERVHQNSGEFHAGRDRDGTWHVSARLPWRASSIPTPALPSP